MSDDNTDTPRVSRRVRAPAPPAQQEILKAAAATRAETRSPIRDEPVRDATRRRRNRPGGQQDKFYINPEMIPADTTYEWKRVSTYGAGDPSYEMGLRENGWEPVDAKRHPELQATPGAIIRDGMILMERPTYLTDEARAEDDDNARALIRAKEQQLGATPQGTLTRDHPTARPQVRRSYSPIEVPPD